MFGLGFGFAGPAFFWTWPVVFIGQFMVALNFAELAARYPISGAIYQWSRRMGGEIVGWFAGWFMILAQIVTASAAAIALQVVLPNVWSGFQIIGEDSALTSSSGAANAVLLGSVLLVLTTFINCIGVNWMSRINNIGVTCEIVGVIAVIGMFFTHAQRGPDVVFDTGSAGGQRIRLGVDHVRTDGCLRHGRLRFGRRTGRGDPQPPTRRTSYDPACTVRFRARRRLDDPRRVDGSALTHRRTPGHGRFAVRTDLHSEFAVGHGLVDRRLDRSVRVHLGHSDCCFTADVLHGPRRALPASQILAKVNPRTGTPIAPSVLIGLVCIAVLAVNVGNSAIFATLSSVCIILIYLAYLMVTVPLLVQRLKGWPRTAVGPKFDAEGKKLFSLGIWGVPVNIAAVAYGALMVINLSWPRAEIFNPPGSTPFCSGPRPSR